MHKLMLDEIVRRCRQRDREGDCPTVDPFSVEQLEDAIIELASRLDTCRRTQGSLSLRLADFIADANRAPRRKTRENKRFFDCLKRSLKTRRGA